MNPVKRIRHLLGMSQQQLADAIGSAQPTVSSYECGRYEIPPDQARKLIAVAAERGVVLSFDDIYMVQTVPGETQEAA